MSLFRSLRVTDVHKTTPDAVVVTLEPVDGEGLSFIPGQYLTFRKVFGGTEVRRNYSICAARGEPRAKIGIKRVDGGAFSTWANTALKPGDVLEAMQPRGNFHAEATPWEIRNHLGFSGGSGITPVLSILKTVLEERSDSSFTLVYANRSPETIMFRDELSDLKDRYLDRLNLIHVLESGMRDSEILSGMIDDDTCDSLFGSLVDVGAADMAFVCGPQPMMATISHALQRHGMARDRIAMELFRSDQPGRLERGDVPIQSRLKGGTIEVSVTIEGSSREIRMSKGQTLLAAALENGLDAPYACRSGICSTCRCRILEGEVEMIANHALGRQEVEDGHILACQSLPVTERVAIEFER